MLHINQLTHYIEGKQLFDNVSIAIPDKQKIGLVGRNGAGKTTLLKLISGDLHPADGDISWPPTQSLGKVSQQVPSGPETPLKIVLQADKEREALLKEADTATEPGRIADIQTRLVDIDAHSAPARAATILAGLGFQKQAQARPCSSFSGGWRMRISLAASLFARPDILLLDEPSNYLDLEGTIWLETFLKNYPHTIIMVSHNRELLNNSVTSILHLANQKLTLYKGNYDQFEQARREQQRLLLSQKKKQDDDRRRLEAFVERFRAKATKAKQAQSRLKVLQKMKPIAAQLDEGVTPFTFHNPARPLGNPLIKLTDVTTGYDEAKPILKELNLSIDMDDRIGILGPNGNGKSTLAKCLSGEIDIFAGHKRQSKKLLIGFFTQHQMDLLNPVSTPYETIAHLMEDATEAQKRAKCASFGFGPSKADTKIKNLSGGEKARLVFALIAFPKPHLLILDEPTNHLDVDSSEALIQALNDYEGALLIISHDRHLLEATVDRLWLVEDGTVTPYKEDLASYRQHILNARKGKKTSGKDEKASEHKISKADARRLAAQKRAELAPLKKQADKHEQQIENISDKIAKLDEQLSDGAIYIDHPDKANELAIKRGGLMKEMEQAEANWLDALEAYEKAKEEV